MTPATTRQLAAAMFSARRHAQAEELRPCVAVEGNQITVRGVRLTDDEMDVLRGIAQKIKDASTTPAREDSFRPEKEATC